MILAFALSTAQSLTHKSTMNENNSPSRHLLKHLKKWSERYAGSTQISPLQKEKIDRINQIMLQIFLDPEDIDEHNVLPFIRHLLLKFNLIGSIHEIDILIEAYTIAIRRIREEDYEIRRPPYWFKGTALNLIRNIRKELDKGEKAREKIKSEQLNYINSKDNLTDSIELEENFRIKAVTNAIDTLNESDRRILNLRIVEGLSWSDIAEKLVDEGTEESFDSKLINCLRKRGQRALKKFRESYLSVIKEYSLD